jgi:integrase
VKKIFAALPKGDPRLRLLIELAAELRAGQAVRAKRTDLVLDAVGGYGLGRFVVHGAGKKNGETVDLHPELRAHVDEVLEAGYLSELEAAYQQGEIADYQLFPAGKLRKRKVPLERGQKKFLNSKRIRTMFHRVEELAGVTPRPGRAFYGLRRQAADMAPAFNQDARVLNRLTGHRDSATRERIYQDPENERVLATTATARRQMRLHIQEGGSGTEPATTVGRRGAGRIPPKHAQSDQNRKSPPA